MGSSLTKEQKVNLEVLRSVLPYQDKTVSTSALATLLKWISKNVPEFPKTEFSLDGELWDKIGSKLYEASLAKDRTAAKLLPVWSRIMEGIKQSRRERIYSDHSLPPSVPTPPLPLAAGSGPCPDPTGGSDPSPIRGDEGPRPPPFALPPFAPPPTFAALPPSTAPSPFAPPTTLVAPLLPSSPLTSCAAASVQPACNVVKDTDGSKPGDRCDPGPEDPERESDAFPPDDTLKEAGMTNFPTAYCDVLEQCKKETILRGDADTLQTFPNQVPRLESLPYEAVKELRESVRTFGVQSAFTYNLLVTNSDTYAMTPHDWKTVLRMILPPMQYTVFMTEYQLHNLTDSSLPQTRTNPCGTAPLQLCQTDVTHVPEFGRLKYAHVTIDTHSSYVFSTAHTGVPLGLYITHWPCGCGVQLEEILQTLNAGENL